MTIAVLGGLWLAFNIGANVALYLDWKHHGRAV